MRIEFREIEYALDADCALLVGWMNDPDIRRLSAWCPGQEQEGRQVAIQDVRARARTRASAPGVDLFVLLDDLPVGYGRACIDPGHTLTAEPGTAWLALVIGEASARRRGIGTALIGELERRIVKGGAIGAEVGVFAFNEPALQFVGHLGYREIGRVRDFTWWNGRFWDDIRFHRSLRL